MTVPSPVVPIAPDPAGGGRGAVPAALRLPGLTVVLPCLDEEANITQAVAEALAAGARCAWAVEVVVVDDGSRDRTRAAAALLASLDPRVRVVAHDRNRGYGAALRSGIAASRMPWVLLTDADLQFDLEQLDTMLEPARESDLVAGFRIKRRDPWPRRAAARAWNLLMRRTFGISISDVDCAFKLVRGPALRALPLRSDGAMISTELVTCARSEGWRIVEIGVHHRPRRAGEATGANAAVVLRAFAERRALARALAAAEGAQTGRRPRRVAGAAQQHAIGR
ncbi:MAG TPA: glycosyltransferase family 2 protein [Solirubrobacteraceae bacterium]|nr:glycosyltransferase family 2 protein [Solirubrobacteraceae bacterium]